MRRIDKEKDKDFALNVIKTCNYATLATVYNNAPYCIPISPVLIGKDIYFHCALEGKKLDNIKINNNVCLTCVSTATALPEQFTMQYESAVIVGECFLVDDESEKMMVLKTLAEKYAKDNIDKFEEEIKKSFKRTCVCKIIIKEITGKASPVM